MEVIPNVPFSVDYSLIIFRFIEGTKLETIEIRVEEG